MNHTNSSGESGGKGKIGWKWGAGATLVAVLLLVSSLQLSEDHSPHQATTKVNTPPTVSVAEPGGLQTGEPEQRREPPPLSPPPVATNPLLVSPERNVPPHPIVAEANVVKGEKQLSLPLDKSVEEKQRGEVAKPDQTLEKQPVVQKVYIKIGANGERLPELAESWQCVEDTHTGLVWEVKSYAPGLRNRNNLYSWYQPHEEQGTVGVADGGHCGGGIECDSYAFVQALNSERLCGYHDWRLPTRAEMLTIVERKNDGDIGGFNRDFFPQGPASWYWTATTNEEHPDYAWYLLFRNGIALCDKKGRSKHLRLVRSEKVPVS